MHLLLAGYFFKFMHYGNKFVINVITNNLLLLYNYIVLNI